MDPLHLSIVMPPTRQVSLTCIASSSAAASRSLSLLSSNGIITTAKATVITRRTNKTRMTSAHGDIYDWTETVAAAAELTRAFHGVAEMGKERTAT